MIKGQNSWSYPELVVNDLLYTVSYQRGTALESQAVINLGRQRTLKRDQTITFLHLYILGGWRLILYLVIGRIHALLQQLMEFFSFYFTSFSCLVHCFLQVLSSRTQRFPMNLVQLDIGLSKGAKDKYVHLEEEKITKT